MTAATAIKVYGQQVEVEESLPTSGPDPTNCVLESEKSVFERSISDPVPRRRFFRNRTSLVKNKSFPTHPGALQKMGPDQDPLDEGQPKFFGFSTCGDGFVAVYAPAPGSPSKNDVAPGPSTTGDSNNSAPASNTDVNKESDKESDASSKKVSMSRSVRLEQMSKCS